MFAVACRVIETVVVSRDSGELFLDDLEALENGQRTKTRRKTSFVGIV